MSASKPKSDQKRKVLAERNDQDAKANKRLQIRFAGFPLIKKLVYEDEDVDVVKVETVPKKENAGFKLLADKENVSELLNLIRSKGNNKELNENGCRTSDVMPKPSLCLQTPKHSPESDTTKTDCAEEPKKAKNCKENLSPELTDLLLRRKDQQKILRPPNAFMLFAKEHRRQVRLDHECADISNREVSVLLGTMWRDMGDEEKTKYYKEAQALEKMHKEMYPSYVYSPTEARLRKQSRVDRRKVKDTPTPVQSCKTPLVTKLEKKTNILKGNPSPSSCKPQLKISNEKKNIQTKTTPKDVPATPHNPFLSPLYHPQHLYKGWPDVGGRMLGKDMCSPHCSCPYHGPSVPRPFLPPFQSPYYQYRPETFHHAVWNPWMMWPPNMYYPNSLDACHKSWNKCCPPSQCGHMRQPRECPTPKEKVSSTMSRQQNSELDGDIDVDGDGDEDVDEDGDDGLRRLVIDEGNSDDVDSENNPLF